jgi:trehalose 6-phosphate synthase
MTWTASPTPSPGAVMPLPERRERWRAMMDTLERHDIEAWRRSYLGALAAA